MSKSIRTVVISLCLAALACSCGGKQDKSTGSGGGDKAADPNAVYGPLEIGADWQSYTQVNKEKVSCDDHGGRLCDTYVNDVGLEAYKNEDADIPVGTVIVKSSFEKNPDGTAGAEGPLFIMVKKEAGFDKDHGDWYYALHWEKITGKWVELMKAEQVYWRTPSVRVHYCWKCHDGYDRALGMVPDEQRAW